MIGGFLIDDDDGRCFFSCGGGIPFSFLFFSFLRCLPSSDRMRADGAVALCVGFVWKDWMDGWGRKFWIMESG